MCVIDIFSKHARIVILKDKKGVSIFNAFQKVLDDSNRSEAKSKGCEPDKICFDKGSEFYNNSFKKWLKDDDIKVFSIRKSVVAERFIRTLKTKIYKYMTLVSKNEYVDKLGDIVDEYNNIHHRTINMEPANVKDNTILILREKLMKNILDLKLAIVSEFLNTKIFSLKDAHQIGRKKFLLIVKLKIPFHGHMLLMIPMVKKLLEYLMEKNYKRLIKKYIE